MNISVKLCFSYWKCEFVTPVPKSYPPEDITHLRKISCTKLFSKVTEMFLAKWSFEDMKANLDKSSYGEIPGMSTSHYLIKMIDKILTSLDNSSRGEVKAVIAQLIDWSKAFDLQCPKLGIESFVKNGVRLSIIPVLISYFQDRTMVVKWHGTESSTRNLPGGGPQGTLIGPLEYLSQSNDNTDFLKEDEKYKFVDDLTILEIVDLVDKIVSYNFKNNVANDIGLHNQFVAPEALLSQENLNKIVNWTETKKMKLNAQKTKIMTFNFTNNYQFSTRIKLNDTILETVKSTKLLGVIIRDDLSWTENTANIVRNAYRKMPLITKLYPYTVPINDLVQIYTTFIRNTLENNCVVWHSRLIEEEINDIERVQKTALKIILKDQYKDYESALKTTNLMNLEKRREHLCLEFALSCTKKENTANLFSKNDQNIIKKEKYFVKFANNERLKKSSIPYMQRLLNQN